MWVIRFELSIMISVPWGNSLYSVCSVFGIWSNPNIVPLFVHCNLWQYIEGGGMSKYCVIGNFCSSTSICAK